MVLLVFASSINVVGSQTIQTSNQIEKNSEISVKPYLYHTWFLYLFGTISNLTYTLDVYHFNCVNLRALMIWNNHHGYKGFSYEHYVNNELMHVRDTRFRGVTLTDTFIWGYFYA